MLVLRSSQETTKMIDPVYFLLQIVIITHLLLENYTENKLGMGSPWYTFGLYFAANLVFLLFCHGFYAAAGEHCEGYNCGDGKTCKACRVFPMLANELTVDDGVECLEYAAGGVTKVAMWIFIEAEVVFSVIGLVLEGLAKKKFRDNAMLVNNTSTDQLELM